MGRLSGKVALITGAGSGIGRGIALRFSQEEASVVAVDLIGDRAEETLKQIIHQGGKAIAIQADVGLASDVDRFVTKTIETFERIDILVNNAGIGGSKACVDTPEEAWDRMVTVNLKSIYLVSKRVIPEMVKNGGGKIINIASIFGLSGAPRTAAYAASKGGVINLTRQLAVDYSSSHIYVNAISPGLIETEMTRHKFSDPQLIHHLMKLIPLGRKGLPADIAGAALFLASEDSDFVTGHNLVVDGGQSIRLE